MNNRGGIVGYLFWIIIGFAIGIWFAFKYLG